MNRSRKSIYDLGRNAVRIVPFAPTHTLPYSGDQESV